MTSELIPIALFCPSLGQNSCCDLEDKPGNTSDRSLSPHFKWVPIFTETNSEKCVQKEEPIRGIVGPALERTDSSTRQSKTGFLDPWVRVTVQELLDKGIYGLIIKTGASGGAANDVMISEVLDVEVETANGAGPFLAELGKAPAHFPVVEEESMSKELELASFVEKVYVLWRWHKKKIRRPRDLIGFHEEHKYQLMAKGALALKAMGRWLAGVSKSNFKDKKERYFELLMETMARPSSLAGHRNAMEHVMGYLKKQLNSREKSDLRAVIIDFHRGKGCLHEPLVALRHYVILHRVPYLMKQTYLDAYPIALMPSAKAFPS